MGSTGLARDVHRRWHRIAQLSTESVELRELRVAIALVCEAPGNPEPRARLREIAAQGELWDQVPPLLAAEARGTRDPVVVEALCEESAWAYEHVEQPADALAALEAAAAREPDNAAYLEQIAWARYLSGVWPAAAEALERLAVWLSTDDAVHVLLAAGKLYRNSGHTDRAIAAYRAIAVRRPANTEALLALGNLITMPPVEAGANPFDAPEPAPVAAVAPTPIVATNPPAVSPVAKPKKRIQIFDVIDEAEIDARFASMFGGDAASAEVIAIEKPKSSGDNARPARQPLARITPVRVPTPPAMMRIAKPPPIPRSRKPPEPPRTVSVEIASIEELLGRDDPSE